MTRCRAIAFPLADRADQMLRGLAQRTASAAIARINGATLLGERAMLANWLIPGRVSAGGGCRLYDALGGTIALNLARPDDRDLLPALFETDQLDTRDHHAVAALIRNCDAGSLVMRGRSMGLAVAMEREIHPGPASLGAKLTEGQPAADAGPGKPRRAPRILDLSALWAGPLAAHLLWLAGGDVVKVESRTRPDAMRNGDAPFYALLNQGKASVVLDFTDGSDRSALLALIAASDIVIEAARPRALMQLGIDAGRIVASSPGLVWVTITAHGAQGEAAGWVGFGDDCSVAGGLCSALRTVTGRPGFVGDAIADPLGGIAAALLAWNGWQTRQGGRFAIALSQVVAHCLEQARHDPAALSADLGAWSAAIGKPFPAVQRRTSGAVAAFGEHTRARLEQVNFEQIDSL